MSHYFASLMQRLTSRSLRNGTCRNVPDHAIRTSFWVDESGQTLVLAAVCMVTLVGMLALSIDAGLLRYQKRQIQTMADAAALAAALEVPACAGTTNCAAMQTAAKGALTENGFSSTVLTNCATRSGTKLELTVNNPPCALSSDPNSGNSNYVETIVSEPVPTVFAKLLGVNSVAVVARAEALKQPYPCTYFLSQSSTQPSLSLINQTISANCIFYLGLSYEFSGSSSTGSTYLVAGAASSSTGAVSPAPIFNYPRLSDPLSGLVGPPYGSCTQTNYTVQTSRSLPSGTYCGTLTIGQSSGSAINVTLSGTYIVLGQLNIDNAVLSGSGVTFYLSQGNGYNYGASTISNLNANLSAPTSGSLQGILYYVDPTLPAGKAGLSVSNWNPGTRLDGILYLPGQKFSASNVTLQGTSYFGIVADYAAMNNTNLTPSTDYSALQNGTPFTTSRKAVANVQ
jgi:Flp pilus assembly protein TadG